MKHPCLSYILLAAMVCSAAGRCFAADRVNGKPIVLNDNGAWCWFQDARAVFDPSNRTLLVGSVANSDGIDGQKRAGDIDLVSYDLASGKGSVIVLKHGLQPQDDHNAPALLIRPDGRYVAMYSRHNQDGFSYWRVSTRPHDGGEWQPEQSFDWNPYLKAVDAATHITYSNLFYLSGEKKTYDFTRGVNLDPSILVSTDDGDKWSFGGKLFTEPRVGYVNGYTKYASNGVDRIDFITTEHHPRDFNNSVYHGYLKAGELHRSDGTLIDPKVLSGSPTGGRPQTELTKVLEAGSAPGGDKLTHAWTADLRIAADGNPCAILTARANDMPENSNYNDHRFVYARFDGTAWKVHPLAKAGARLWDAEQDYTGLAALDPLDVNIVYISATSDPRNGAALKSHEIFKGITADAGATWKWTPLTEDSSVDNLRPITVSCGEAGTAVLWFRGKMTRSQHYNCAIVGVIDRPGEPAEGVTFVSPLAGKPKPAATQPATGPAPGH